MLGFVVRCGDQFKTFDGWTTDVLAAVRFARESDAQGFVDAPDEYVVPVLMSPQFPAELQAVRDAITEAGRAHWQYENFRPGGVWPSRNAYKLRRAAEMAQRHAEKLCFELFRRAILREPTPLPKVLT